MFSCFGGSQEVSQDYSDEFPLKEKSNIVHYKDRGNEFFKNKKFAEAAGEYSRALTYFAKSSSGQIYPIETEKDAVLLTNLLSNRSAAHFMERKWDEAQRDAQLAVKWRPDWIKGHFRLAEVLFARRQFSEALESYKAASSKTGADSSVSLRMLKCQLALEDWNEGLVIHQLLPGRDICFKGWLTPIQNLIFDFAADMKNFIYIIEDVASKQCVVIDACWDIDGIAKYIEERGLILKDAFITHYHVDHAGGIPPPPFDKYYIRIDGLAKLLKKFPQITAFIHKDDIPGLVQANPEIPLERIYQNTDGFVYKLQSKDKVFEFKFIHTPGHTPGSQCIIYKDRRLFTGDTYFIGNCGRIDFPDSNVDDMRKSLLDKLAKLPDDMIMYPGHNYGGDFTLIGREKEVGLLREDHLNECDKFCCKL